ncbi:unnamed protein product [Strongylus vulgaris]|uniref:Uncharacterized protein n=1 Tax=Strongylus vulgaris TaxID=40348 RepID=A0A3P7J9T1_STRVU|nr:unnamed protein product [Strongylus vulgaris]
MYQPRLTSAVVGRSLSFCQLHRRPAGRYRCRRQYSVACRECDVFVTGLTTARGMSRRSRVSDEIDVISTSDDEIPLPPSKPPITIRGVGHITM